LQPHLAGRTVAYESLSGGAKEQLGIVARLASAALVAKEDGVPVVIDDALGFTDACGSPGWARSSTRSAETGR
jgi:uncharacterized protein YhaN